MSDFGGKLRLARERRGISLRQIAASTKISVGALEALERNDISKLPGGIFSRAFVRSYAVEVGLDPDDTVREFLDRFQGERSPSAAAPVAVPEEESAFESQQRMASVLLKLVLISIPLIGAILYFTMRSRPVQTAPAAAVEQPVAPAVELPAPPPADPRSQPPAAPASTPLDPSRKTMRLELHPTGDCWVSLTVDGAQIMKRMMRAGEKDVREVRETAVVDVGDAGAFAFSINGRPGKPLGETGQVRTLRLTRDTMAGYLR
jgi:cytoskeletal protein RodZ